MIALLRSLGLGLLWKIGNHRRFVMDDRDQDALLEYARGRDPMLVPLAERMRPQKIEDICGQTHLSAPGGLLDRIARAPRLPSMIFYGPPGTGKTTLARLMVDPSRMGFEVLSATDSGVKDIRAAIDRARLRRTQEARHSVLFIDEIHRFNRTQQDSLLPHVEAGICSLIGATTEHPSFSLNAALLSRARVVTLKALTISDLVTVLKRALMDSVCGLGSKKIEIEERLLAGIAQAADGDARRALNLLELSVDLLASGQCKMEEEVVVRALGKRTLRYDRSGEEHYQLTSALIKSMRASDADASVYWLARMLESGEDPRFIARRLLIFSSEDVGNADPQALILVNAAAQAVERVGMPEAAWHLTQACLYLALAIKSNATIESYRAARQEVRRSGSLAVPLFLRPGATSILREEGYGRGYQSPHEFSEHVDPCSKSLLPEALAAPNSEGGPSTEQLPVRNFVPRLEQGWEGTAFQRIQAIRRREKPAGGD